MAELLCAERMSDPVAEVDPAIFTDRRVLENLLTSEARYVPRCIYFGSVQPDIRPFMRRVVATWMVEVTEAERCEPHVFSIAINLLDRILCEVRIDKTQLQMVACVCLLLASKVRQCHALSVHKLVYYTDHSVSAEQIRKFELVMLSHLQWDLTSVTGYDLVDHVMERIMWSRDRFDVVRRHAKTLVDLCCMDPHLIRTPPSMIASACLLAAARGLKVADATAGSICRLTRCNPEEVTRTACNVERLMIEVAYSNPKPPPSQPHAAPRVASDQTYVCKDVYTPTDVSEISF